MTPDVLKAAEIRNQKPDAAGLSSTGYFEGAKP
jgi:hypothetical protein